MNDLLKNINVNKCAPRPWSLDVPKNGPPAIYDANGECVLVLSTGTLSGPYETEKLLASIKIILNSVNV